METSPFQSPTTTEACLESISPCDERLLRIASNQRRLFLLLGLRLLSAMLAMALYESPSLREAMFGEPYGFAVANLFRGLLYFLMIASIIACYALSRQFLPRPPSILIALTQFFPPYSFLPQFLLIAIAFRALKQHGLKPGWFGLSESSIHSQLATRESSETLFL